MNAISTPKSRYGVVSQLRRSDSIRQDYGVTVDWTRDVCTRGRCCCCCWMQRSASTGECTSASPCVVVVTVSCEKTRAWSLCTRHRKDLTASDVRSLLQTSYRRAADTCDTRKFSVVNSRSAALDARR